MQITDIERERETRTEQQNAQPHSERYSCVIIFFQTHE